MPKKLFDNLKVSRIDGAVNDLSQDMFVIAIGKGVFKYGDTLDKYINC